MSNLTLGFLEVQPDEKTLYLKWLDELKLKEGFQFVKATPESQQVALGQFQ